MVKLSPAANVNGVLSKVKSPAALFISIVTAESTVTPPVIPLMVTASA